MAQASVQARWGAPLAFVAMAAELALVLPRSFGSTHPGALASAVAADLAILLGYAAWSSGGQPLLTRSLRRVGRGVLWGALALELGAHLLGLPSPGLRRGTVVLELVVQLALVWAIVQAARGASFWGELAHALEAALPAPVAAAVVFELRLLYAGGCALLGRGGALPEPSPDRFVPMRASRSGWVLPFVAIVSVIELAALHALVHARWPGHPLAHVVLVALHLYGLIWLAGDRWWMKRTAHRIEGGVLRLELGLRFSAEVPLGSIARARRMSSDAERAAVRRRTRVVQVTPLDAPNVHLCLAGPVAYRGFFGRRGQMEHLDLFVDRPDELLAAIAARAH
jgi:hypothetical protein